jgi:FkbM family methyltransferase
MISRIISKFSRTKKTELQKLFDLAYTYPRYQPYTIRFKGLKLKVTDLISVVWQLKEYFEDNALLFRCEHGSPLIIDCGSNVGVSVLYFKYTFPNARIIGFEPDHHVFQCLEANICNNNISKNDIEIFEKAVWSHDAGIEFGCDNADGGSIFLNSNKVFVETVRLKKMVDGLPKIDLLKIDIEGAEVDVIADLGSSLQNVKYLFCEYHSFSDHDQQLSILLKTLEQNNFKYKIRSLHHSDCENGFFQNPSPRTMDVQLNIYAVNQTD